jgi:hypothetical protein
VLAPSGEDRDLAHAGEVTREEAPDHARPDDADPLDHARAIIARCDMSVNWYESRCACGSRGAGTPGR